VVQASALFNYYHDVLIRKSIEKLSLDESGLQSLANRRLAGGSEEGGGQIGHAINGSKR